MVIPCSLNRQGDGCHNFVVCLILVLTVHVSVITGASSTVSTAATTAATTLATTAVPINGTTTIAAAVATTAALTVPSSNSQLPVYESSSTDKVLHYVVTAVSATALTMGLGVSVWSSVLGFSVLSNNVGGGVIMLLQQIQLVSVAGSLMTDDMLVDGEHDSGRARAFARALDWSVGDFGVPSVWGQAWLDARVSSAAHSSLRHDIYSARGLLQSLPSDVEVDSWSLQCGDIGLLHTAAAPLLSLFVALLVTFALRIGTVTMTRCFCLGSAIDANGLHFPRWELISLQALMIVFGRVSGVTLLSGCMGWIVIGSVAAVLSFIGVVSLFLLVFLQIDRKPLAKFHARQVDREVAGDDTFKDFDKRQRRREQKLAQRRSEMGLFRRLYSKRFTGAWAPVSDDTTLKFANGAQMMVTDYKPADRLYLPVITTVSFLLGLVSAVGEREAWAALVCAGLLLTDGSFVGCTAPMNDRLKQVQRVAERVCNVLLFLSASAGALPSIDSHTSSNVLMAVGCAGIAISATMLVLSTTIAVVAIRNGVAQKDYEDLTKVDIDATETGTVATTAHSIAASRIDGEPFNGPDDDDDHYYDDDDDDDGDIYQRVETVFLPPPPPDDLDIDFQKIRADRLYRNSVSTIHKYQVVELPPAPPPSKLAEPSDVDRIIDKGVLGTGMYLGNSYDNWTKPPSTKELMFGRAFGPPPLPPDDTQLHRLAQSSGQPIRSQSAQSARASHPTTASTARQHSRGVPTRPVSIHTQARRKATLGQA